PVGGREDTGDDQGRSSGAGQQGQRRLDRAVGAAAQAGVPRQLVPLPSTFTVFVGCKPSPGFVLGVSCSAATRRLLRPRHCSGFRSPTTATVSDRGTSAGR